MDSYTELKGSNVVQHEDTQAPEFITQPNDVPTFYGKGIPELLKEQATSDVFGHEVSDEELSRTAAGAGMVIAPASTDLVQAFLAAMKQMSADNRETTLAAIKELKALSPEDQERADREKQQLMEQTLRRVESAKQQEAAIAEMQDGCAHTMPNGQTNFRGQVLSNGWAHVFCSHCHKSYDFQATDVEANKSGLNVDKWGANSHTIIKNRAASSLLLTPPPVPKVPAGATIIFG